MVLTTVDYGLRIYLTQAIFSCGCQCTDIQIQPNIQPQLQQVTHHVCLSKVGGSWIERMQTQREQTPHRKAPGQPVDSNPGPCCFQANLCCFVANHYDTELLKLLNFFQTCPVLIDTNNNCACPTVLVFVLNKLFIFYNLAFTDFANSQELFLCICV